MPADDVTILRCDWKDGVALLPPASIDLLYVDPPFNTGRVQVGRRGHAATFTDRWPTTQEYITWLRDRLTATLPCLKPTASVLLHIDFRASHHARVLLDDLLGEANFVNHLIWSYGLGGSSPRRFARKHDDILFYAIDATKYYFNPPRVPATSRRMAGQLKKATDVLAIPSLNNQALERTGYPTQKPLALLDLLVRACSPPRGVVLDPCCGSGTTLLAANAAQRSAIGFDLSPLAIATVINRFAPLPANSKKPPRRPHADEKSRQ